MSAPETIPSKSPWWLESLLWSVGILGAVGVAAYVNETAREIAAQGLAYLFTFFSTPFVLETSTAFIGFCVFIFNNNLRIEREGDGWVLMEVKQPAAAEDRTPGHTPTDKQPEV